MKELEDIATSVCAYWYKKEKESTGRAPRELAPFYEKKLAKLANDLHFPTSVVKFAFEQEAHKLMRKS